MLSENSLQGAAHANVDMNPVDKHMIRYLSIPHSDVMTSGHWRLPWSIPGKL